MRNLSTNLFLDSIKDMLRKKLMMTGILFLTEFTKIIAKSPFAATQFLDQSYVNPRNVSNLLFLSLYLSLYMFIFIFLMIVNAKIKLK